MHSSRNSRVRWGSFVASFSLTDLINIVLFDGIHKPKTERNKFNRLNYLYQAQNFYQSYALQKRVAIIQKYRD
jgi:hypothetical protein